MSAFTLKPFAGLLYLGGLALVYGVAIFGMLLYGIRPNRICWQGWLKYGHCPWSWVSKRDNFFFHCFVDHHGYQHRSHPAWWPLAPFIPLPLFIISAGPKFVFTRWGTDVAKQWAVTHIPCSYSELWWGSIGLVVGLSLAILASHGLVLGLCWLVPIIMKHLQQVGQALAKLPDRIFGHEISQAAHDLFGKVGGLIREREHFLAEQEHRREEREARWLSRLAELSASPAQVKPSELAEVLPQSIVELACSGTKPRPMTVRDLPREKRTVWLRFWDLKAKVCRPYAE